MSPPSLIASVELVLVKDGITCLLHEQLPMETSQRERRLNIASHGTLTQCAAAHTIGHRLLSKNSAPYSILYRPSSDCRPMAQRSLMPNFLYGGGDVTTAVDALAPLVNGKCYSTQTG